MSRPIGRYHIENFISDLLKQGYEPEKLLPLVIGYNVYVRHELCFALERTNPKSSDFYDGKVTDYLGNTYEINQREAIALYETGRLLGDTNKRSNADNVAYLKSLGKDVNVGEKWLQLKNGEPQIVDVIGIIYGKDV